MRNRTLMNMVRSMLRNLTLFVSLWMYALKNVIYQLNRVSSKAIPKTPFELWMNKTPSIKHLYVWGCQTEIKIHIPQERKLDARRISEYFISYLEKSKGYMFYRLNHSMRIVETENARFIENAEISGSTITRDVKIKEIRVQVSLACASNSKVIVPLVVIPKIMKRNKTIMSP